jgi:hypothetical protein
MILILVANCRSCREAQFEACQLAGSPPVQWRAGPECLQAEEVERAGHICVVETVFGQASIACAPGAVAGGLVHGAFDAGAAGVVGVEGDAVFGGAGGGGPGPACQADRGRCISSATRRSPMPKPAELHRVHHSAEPVNAIYLRCRYRPPAAGRSRTHLEASLTCSVITSVASGGTMSHPAWLQPKTA